MFCLKVSLPLIWFCFIQHSLSNFLCANKSCSNFSSQRWLHRTLTLRLFPSAMYCVSIVCGLCTTQYPSENKEKSESKLVSVMSVMSRWVEWTLTGRNRCCLHRRGGRWMGCHFHFKHFRGSTNVELVFILIVMFKEFTWDVVIFLINVVWINVSFLFGWTVMCLR